MHKVLDALVPAMMVACLALSLGGFVDAAFDSLAARLTARENPPKENGRETA